MADTGIIVRRWVSRIRTSDRAAYVAYVEATGLADYRATRGNLDAQILMRDLGDGTSEVTTISWWQGMDAISAFAGEEISAARYYPDDDRFLLDKPTHVEHLELVAGSRAKMVGGDGLEPPTLSV